MAEELKSAVIFDFDGVLANTENFAYRVICHIAEKKKIPPPSVEFLKNHHTQDIIRALHLSWWEVPYYMALGRRWAAKEHRNLQLFPWAGELLRAARLRAGRTFIVSSNSTDNIITLLSRHELQKEVNRIVGGVGMLRKARKLKSLIRAERLDPARVLYFGDESRDIDAARTAGVRSVAVGWGLQSLKLLESRGPDFSARDASEALALVSDYFLMHAASNEREKTPATP